ncbi:MAG: 50S ribosomal protein L35 [Oscillospiraceae bacterium]|jgi:large subunit ribosomal protein L35|nr:50S ribosomal protein L35 [Oscillospiraceae bacterium]
MPKIKTHSGTKKRFKVSSNGKFMHAKSNKSHILNKKTRKRKRNLRKLSVTGETNCLAIRRLLPYS